MSRPRTSRYSPHSVDAEVLEAILVARSPLLDTLVRDLLESAKRGVGRYEALTGPRGVGKSHLVALLAHRVRAHADRGPLLVSRLGEEEHVASLVDLLGRVLAALPHEDGQPDPRDLVARVRKAPHGEQLDRVIAMLDARVAARPVLLVVENLDRIFAAIGPEGQSRLRAFLQARANWSVAATSCTWPEPFTDARRPFYNTFHRRTLAPLLHHECHDMLRRLAVLERDDALLAQLNAPEAAARVGAIRHLLGGNPRAMALLFPFIRGGRLDDLDGAFHELAEELTPYFQEQIARRPPGQQPYLEHLASNWYPLTVGELAELTYSTPQTASGQLRYLRRDRLVVSTEAGREQFYEIGEPLHRLAWAMKRPDRAPAALARFVSAWLAREELRRRWDDSCIPDEERRLYRLAWTPPVDPGLPAWVRARAQEIGALEDEAAAVREAEEFYRVHSSPVSMTVLLATVGQAAPGRVTALAEEGLERFGDEVALAIVLVLNAFDAPLGESQRARCREALARQLASPMSAVALLAEHGASPEVLDRAAACVEAALREDSVVATGLVRRLLHLGDSRRAAEIARASAPERLRDDDRLAWIEALVAVGEREEAMRVAAGVATGLRGAVASAARSRAMLALGDADEALAEAARGLTRWPEVEALRDIAARAAWYKRDFAEAERQLAWLAARPTAGPYQFAHLGCARVYLRRYDAAIAPLEQAVAAGTLPWGRVELGVARFGAGQLTAHMAEDLPPLIGALLASLGDSPRPLPPPTLDDENLDLALISAWFPRFFARCEEDGAARLRTVFSGADARWVEPMTGCVLAVVAARLNLRRPVGLDAFLDALAEALPLGTQERLLRAVVRLDASVQAYTRLAAPERAFIREFLEKVGATDVLGRLPREADPDD